MVRITGILFEFCIIALIGFFAGCSAENLDELETGRYGALFLGGIHDGNSGSALSGVGDVDGNGFDDILIGSPHVSSNATFNHGVVYLVYGKQLSNSDTDLTLSDLPTNPNWYGVVFIGYGDDSRCGEAVSPAGDFNNDGFADFAFSCPGADYYDNSTSIRSNAGVTYIMFGGNIPNATVYLDRLSVEGFQGLGVWGAAAGDNAGSALAGAGDVNNDGYDDVLIGSPNHNNFTGAVYLIFGSAGVNSYYADIDLSGMATSSLGVAIHGVSPYTYTGLSVALVDMNGDERDDVIIGAQSDSYGSTVNGGTVYVLSGVNVTGDLQLSGFISDEDTGFKIYGTENDYLGSSVHRAGDVNNDGLQDLILLGRNTSVDNGLPGSGVFYVVYGRSGGSAGSDLFTSNLTHSPSLGFRILPAGDGNRHPGDAVGVSDQNNDGIDDVAVTLQQYDPSGTNHSTVATVFIVYGASGNVSTEVALGNFSYEEPLGFSLVTSSPASNVTRVASAGDFNRDGHRDMLIGCPFATTANGHSRAGLSYLFLNRYAGIPPFQTPTHSPTAAPTDANYLVRMSKTYTAENLYAFAAIHPQTGLPVTWGAFNLGGNATDEALRLIQRIVAGTSSFVGVTVSGGLVAWGTNSSTRGWRDLLYSSNIVAESVVSTGGAYAGITTAGGVFAIGTPALGGDVKSAYWSNGFVAQLSYNIRSLTASGASFAAVTVLGEVYTWGSRFASGGISSETMPALSNVQMVAATSTSFAALRENGSVVTFGDANSGGNSSAVADQLASGVVHIVGSKSVFAAFKFNGSLVTWGHPTRGGDSSAVASRLQSDVIRVMFNDMAFAALKSDGSVVTWGEDRAGGDSSSVASVISAGVTNLYATGKAFAALTNTGRVVAWGASTHGGEVPSSLASSLASGVRSVSTTRRAFAALKEDGSVVVWGNAYQGGEAYSVAPFLTSNVNLVCGNEAAFTAVRNDGLVVGWGHMAVLGTTGGTVLAQNISYAGVTSCA